MMNNFLKKKKTEREKEIIWDYPFQIFIVMWGFFCNRFSFLPTGKYVIHVKAWTKFPIYKVWWLRKASQIGYMFIPLCEKVV